MRWRNIVGVLGLGLSLSGAFVMAKNSIIDGQNPSDFITGIPVGPTLEEAVRNNPGVRNAVARSNNAKIGLFLIVMGAAAQLTVIFLSR